MELVLGMIKAVLWPLVFQILFILSAIYFFNPRKAILSKILLVLAPILGIIFSLVEIIEWNNKVPVWGHIRIIFSFSFSVFVFIMLLVSNINKISKTDLVRTLLLYFFTMCCYFSESLPLFILFWMLSFYPLWLELKEELKDLKHATFLWHHLVSTLLLIGGVILLTLQHREILTFSNITHLSKTPFLKVGILMIIFSAFIREGLFPFHLWVRSCNSLNPYPVKITFYLSNIGLFLYYKLCAPLLLLHFHNASLVVTSFAILSGLYFANLAFVQKTVRMTFSYIMLGQFSFMFALLEQYHNQVKAVVLTQFFSISISYGALFSLIYLIEQKVGLLSRSIFYGLYRENQKISAIFLLFCLSIMATPCTLGFISEEMMFHHMIEHYSIFGIAHVICSALNGINVYMLYSRIFGGKREYYYSIDIKLNLSQKAGYFIILSALIFFGMFPQSILALMSGYV